MDMKAFFGGGTPPPQSPFTNPITVLPWPQVGGVNVRCGRKDLGH